MKQKISEFVKLPEFEGLLGNYRLVSVGYVHKDRDDILVGYRNKDSDPERNGLIVLPSGGLRNGESFEEAVIRETLEETGVYTLLYNNDFSHIEDSPYLKEYGPVVAITNKNGTIWIFARDTEKRYTGKMFDLYPLTEPQETSSDLKSPHYEPFEFVINNPKLMPELGIAIDLISEKKFGYKTKGKIVLEEEDFSGFMKEAIKESILP